MKYRVNWSLHCTCGAEHGNRVETFEAKTDEEAARIVRQFMENHDPPNRGNGIYYSPSKWVRVEQEEVGVTLLLKNFGVDPL